MSHSDGPIIDLYCIINRGTPMANPTVHLCWDFLWTWIWLCASRMWISGPCVSHPLVLVWVQHQVKPLVVLNPTSYLPLQLLWALPNPRNLESSIEKQEQEEAVYPFRSLWLFNTIITHIPPLYFILALFPCTWFSLKELEMFCRFPGAVGKAVPMVRGQNGSFGTAECTNIALGDN